MPLPPVVRYDPAVRHSCRRLQLHHRQQVLATQSSPRSRLGVIDSFGIQDSERCGEVIVTKGGLKMKESPADASTDGADAGKAPVNITASGGRGGVAVDLGKGSYYSFANNKFEARKLTMTSLADTLGRFVDRQVVDMTDLKASYDFTLNFSLEDYQAMLIRSAIAAGVSLPPEALRALDVSSGDSLFASLQGLGLKLELRKAPLEVLVFDQVLKMPTEN
jgi:uncharacterized protein (TIGR03435 family)